MQGDKLAKISDGGQRINVSLCPRESISESSPTRRCPTNLPSSSSSFFSTPYASTFPILQNLCHRYSCLQSSQVPGFSPINNYSPVLFCCRWPLNKRTLKSTLVDAEEDFHFSFQDFSIPMTLVQTQICGTLQLDTMAGYNPQKNSVRTKAGAARYIVIFVCFVCYLRVCSEMSCRSKVMSAMLFFGFCAQHQHHRLPKD